MRRGYQKMMPEYYRDMDMDEGRMYYTSGSSSMGGSYLGVEKSAPFIKCRHFYLIIIQ